MLSSYQVCENPQIALKGFQNKMSLFMIIVLHESMDHRDKFLTNAKSMLYADIFHHLINKNMRYAYVHKCNSYIDMQGFTKDQLYKITNVKIR